MPRDVSSALSAVPSPWWSMPIASAGEEGASLRELMQRMGHSSTRAAVIYQHRTMHRDKFIADAMGKRAMAELKRSGPQRARGKKKRKGGIR